MGTVARVCAVTLGGSSHGSNKKTSTRISDYFIEVYLQGLFNLETCPLRTDIHYYWLSSKLSDSAGKSLIRIIWWRITRKEGSLHSILLQYVNLQEQRLHFCSSWEKQLGVRSGLCHQSTVSEADTVSVSQPRGLCDCVMVRLCDCAIVRPVSVPSCWWCRAAGSERLARGGIKLD